MTANTNLNVAELDYETLRNALKQSFVAHETFKDYNFDGSALAILLDVLAHDTYYKAFYLNMAVNESFLDSSTLRSAAVSRAKDLGYVPRSAKGAYATIQLRVTAPDSPDFIYMTANTRFRGLLDGSYYTFSNPESYTIVPVSGQYNANVYIREGVATSETSTVSTSEKPLTISLSNKNIDTDTLSVWVKDSVSSGSWRPWSVSTDILDVLANSEIYWIQQNLDGFYEVQFGDNVLGKAPVVGNMIEVKYAVTKGTGGNKVYSFSKIDSIGSYPSFSISTILPSIGGQDEETLESIKFNAPKTYDMQGRTVTIADYKQHVIANFSDIESITTWGGEENVTPRYGKVFLCVKPTGGLTLSNSRKQDILNSIKGQNVLGVEPLIVDPTYLYVIPRVQVYFDTTQTTRNAASILSAVGNEIVAFEDAWLNNFDRQFFISKFTNTIDRVDSAIRSNDTAIDLQKRFSPATGTARTYSFPFHCEIYHPNAGFSGILKSTGFNLPGVERTAYLDDDGYGNVRTYYMSDAGARIAVNATAGTIDYETGLITLNGFNPNSAPLGEIRITITPKSKNITPVRNEILLIAEAGIYVYEAKNSKFLTSGSVTTIGTTTAIIEKPYLTSVVI